VTYDQLYKFISEGMQMQDVYQPVMLIEIMLANYEGAVVWMKEQ
jgi:hypothetical protein